MIKFSNLAIGDMFNTKEARWVKVTETEAIVVMSSILTIGRIHPFSDERSIVVLYSYIL
jgi:hypothetical protein